MSGPTSRRGFLRGLATLPLVGGGVTLIGQPTAVAVEPSLPMLVEYATFLHGELRLLGYELAEALNWKVEDFESMPMQAGDYHFPRGGSWLDVPKPSTRAALVLTTVGAPLTGRRFVARRVWAPAE